MKQEKNLHNISIMFFVAAIIIHAAGYFSNYLYIFGWFIWIPAIVLTIIAVRRMIKDNYIINFYINTKKLMLTNEFIITCIVFVYVVFNVIYNAYILRNGGGQYTQGVYYLINQGERIREITQKEYGQLLLAEYRMFSGHILLLYSLVTLFFKTRMMEDETE